jgi:hypothetical protein
MLYYRRKRKRTREGEMILLIESKMGSMHWCQRIDHMEHALKPNGTAHDFCIWADGIPIHLTREKFVQLVHKLYPEYDVNTIPLEEKKNDQRI